MTSKMAEKIEMVLGGDESFMPEVEEDEQACHRSGGRLKEYRLEFKSAAV